MTPRGSGTHCPDARLISPLTRCSWKALMQAKQPPSWSDIPSHIWGSTVPSPPPLWKCCRVSATASVTARFHLKEEKISQSNRFSQGASHGKILASHHDGDCTTNVRPAPGILSRGTSMHRSTTVSLLVSHKGGQNQPLAESISTARDKKDFGLSMAALLSPEGMCVSL